MYGPCEPGHWTRAARLKPKFEFLEAGRRYRVRGGFTDFDGDLHLPGEEWTFLGMSFSPYDDGMSFFVSLDGSREWQIRLQWRPEAQGGILEWLDSWVIPA
jgi:hypothetical protein